MINPDIGVRSGEQARPQTASCAPTMAGQPWPPRPTSGGGEGGDAGAPLLLWRLHTAGDSASAQAPLWGHCSKAPRCQSHRAEVGEGEGLARPSRRQPALLPTPRGRRGLTGYGCWRRGRGVAQWQRGPTPALPRRGRASQLPAGEGEGVDEWEMPSAEDPQGGRQLSDSGVGGTGL